MISRRIYEHVKAHNWFAVAIDFVIVVAGVFMGVQVNGWWASQSDARREAAYLAALKEDFSLVIAELEDDAAEYEETAAAMSFLLDQSRKPAPDAPLAELVAAARRLTVMEGTPIVSGTYSNLTGSGDLAIIKSQKVKNALSDFYGQAGVIDLIGNTHEMQLVNVFQPYIIENLDYVGMLSKGRGIAPPAEFAPELILSVLPTQEFRNIAAVKWDVVTDIRDIMMSALSEAREVERLLAEELEQKS